MVVLLSVKFGSKERGLGINTRVVFAMLRPRESHFTIISAWLHCLCVGVYTSFFKKKAKHETEIQIYSANSNKD